MDGRPAFPAHPPRFRRDHSSRHGVLTRILRGVALQVSPTFVITEAEIRTMVDGFEATLSKTGARAAAHR